MTRQYFNQFQETLRVFVDRTKVHERWSRNDASCRRWGSSRESCVDRSKEVEEVRRKSIEERKESKRKKNCTDEAKRGGGG